MDILSSINCPKDLRTLSKKDLKKLTTEVRSFLLQSISKSGGHLSSNLGTVELTVAIHYVFNTPFDKLVWDVGHQSYAHKILTGRRDSLATIRKTGGISGFPKRTESEYDDFGTAHSSTSISAVLGMAVAAKLKGLNVGENRRRHIAVIGDGALSAGMAFEALNNAGSGNKDLDLLVILNDNDMSISQPVGALSNYLTRLLTGKIYSSAREFGKQVLKKIPPVLDIAKKLEGGAKGFLTPSTLFEAFGFNYFGPIDGHDLHVLVSALKNLKQLKGPQFLHVVTKKGQGYQRAELDPILYHGPGSFDPAEGVVPKGGPKKKTYSQVFGDWLCDVAKTNKKLVAITPAMKEGSGMQEFARLYPAQFFDVGIAEQHAVTFAAGLACEGLKPVVAIYSTFLQRGYDQLIHDVAIQNLDVVFAIDRAGLVGADGATHAGSYDLSYLRCIPNMVVMAPKDEFECCQMLNTAISYIGPVAVRYPRGSGPGKVVVDGGKLDCLEVGKSEVLRKPQTKKDSFSITNNKKVAILAFGSMVGIAQELGDLLNTAVVNMRFIKPIDTVVLQEIISDYDLICTLEENVVSGGAGSACAEAINTFHSVKGGKKAIGKVYHFGLPDKHIDHGDPKELLALEGLSVDKIRQAIIEISQK
jgi:1-deoxy-D-xylulose-5-phosphate synthase